MPASATNTFSMAGVIPAFGPWGEAKRISVKLPNSVTYVKGTILGEVAGVNEVQTITITGTPTGGTFTITYSGQTTSAIAYNATAATVQTALEALSNIGVNNVSCSGGAFPGTAVSVTFQNTLGKQNIAAMTTTDSLTGGSSPASAVTTATAGVAATYGTYKAYLSSSTDGSQTAKAILEFDCATDSSGNITLGGASGGGDKQQTSNSVPAFVSGTFRCEDLQQTAGAGQLTDTAVGHLGRLLEGNVTSGLLRVG